MEIDNQNHRFALVNGTPHFRVELLKLANIWQSENLRFTFYSSNAKGRSTSIEYKPNITKIWKIKFGKRISCWRYSL